MPHKWRQSGVEWVPQFSEANVDMSFSNIGSNGFSDTYDPDAPANML